MIQIIRRIVFRTIINRAIEFERRAYYFYDEALNRIENAELQELLKKLRGAELEHILKLLELDMDWFSRRNINSARIANNPPEVSESSISAIVAGDRKRKSMIPHNADLNSVLSLALNKEKEAYFYYIRITSKVKRDYILQVFSFLADQERSHIQWIAVEIEKILTL